MISRGTPQDILWVYGCHALLHVNRHLVFCAMYNKYTAAVTACHNTERASTL